jgi:tetratricopeptide (TPR) repeat protein
MGFNRTFSFLLPSFLFFVLCANAQTSEHIDAISAALHEGSFSKALELLKPALQSFPGDARLWAMQGTANAGNGETKAALASFKIALNLAPDYVPALHGAAQIEFQAADPAAIPILQRLLRLHPSDPVAHGMLAILEYQQGDCTAAVVHFAKADALFDTKPQALHAYAACLVRLKRNDEAIKILQRAVVLNSNDSRERQLLASLQIMAHHPDEALATLSPMLSGTPDYNILELASAAYEDAHETEKAVDALRQAILSNPQDVQLYVEFAALASAHQSFEVGINIVNDGINLQPKAAALYFARGVLYVQNDEYDRAQADFETAYNLDPAQSLSTAAQGLAAIQQNDPDQALRTVQKKLALRPNDPILLYIEADLLIEKGAAPGTAEFERAMHSATKAVTLNPTLGPAHAVLGKLYLQAGNYSASAEQCRKALEVDPKDQVSLYHLIQALRKTNEKNEIPQLLQRLALLRKETTRQAREQLPIRLVEDDPQSR